jgi:hypothetical protein
MPTPPTSPTTPTPPRAVDRELLLTPLPHGFRAVVRTRVDRGLRVFAAGAGVVWAGMLFVGWRTLRDPGTPPLGVAFMAFWIANLAMSGPVAICWILTSRGGREVIELTGRALAVRRSAGLREPQRSFDLARVVNVRRGEGPPHVAFDHGTETLRIGEGLSPADLERLEAALLERAG